MDSDWVNMYLGTQPFERRIYSSVDILKTEKTDVVFSMNPARGKPLLNLISITKALVLKSQTAGTQVKVDMTRRPTYGSMLEVPHGEISELDIKSAYPRAGTILKVWPEYWEDRMMKIKNKETRLSLIGCLGSKYSRVLYDEDGIAGALEGPFQAKTFPSLMKIHVWIDQHMQELAKIIDKGFKWYWVDGIFIDKRFEKIASDYFHDHGLDHKVVRKYVLKKPEDRKIYVIDEKGEKKDYSHMVPFEVWGRREGCSL